METIEIKKNENRTENPKIAKAKPHGENRRRGMAQMRIVVAIPAFTTFIVLALGLVLVELNQRQLLNLRRMPTPMDMQNTMSDIVLAIVIAAAGALAAGLLLAVAVLKPFRDIESKAKRMAAGDMTGRLKSGPMIEFQEMADAFNDMASSLSDYFVKGCASGTLTLDADGRFTSVNHSAAEMLECGEAELLGELVEDTFMGRAENAGFAAMLREGLEKRRPKSNFETTIARGNGQRLSGKVGLSLLRDQRHSSLGLLVTIEDISSEKRIREQLRRIDRLTTLTGLAAGVAHQVRNPLCSIRGMAQLVEEGAGEDEALRGQADEIIRNADRINGAISEMLDTLRPGTPDWNYDRVEQVVHEAMMRGASHTEIPKHSEKH